MDLREIGWARRSVRSWLRHYARSRKVSGSILDVIGFSFDPEVYSDSNRNEYQESENLTAICEPIV
jgi:hypothetical protein